MPYAKIYTDDLGSITINIYIYIYLKHSLQLHVLLAADDKPKIQMSLQIVGKFKLQLNVVPSQKDSGLAIASYEWFLLRLLSRIFFVCQI